MKLLQNKSTGEIGCLICSFGKTPEKITVAEYIDGKRGSRVWYYNSLAELNEEWEDYNEPEDFWYISPTGTPIKSTTSIYDPLEIYLMKRIGNYFESEEDAEQAVEKLKAWKRLEDKGFRFTGWATNEGIRGIDFEVPDSFFSEHNHSCISDETRNDLDSLFCSEDDYEPTNAEINDLTDMGYGG